jgi:uncharacterized protein DUF6941
MLPGLIGKTISCALLIQMELCSEGYVVAIKPIIQALLLADNVYTDAETGKRIISGVFDTITLSEIPADFPYPTCVYVSLTAVRGEIDAMLRYVDLDSDEVLMEHGPKKLISDDHLASLDFSTPMPPLPVPHEGVFALEVHVNDELIGMVRITVRQAADEIHEEGDENE